MCTNTCSKPCSKQEQDKQMMIVISDALVDPRTMVIKSSNTNIAKSVFVKKKVFLFFFFPLAYLQCFDLNGLRIRHVPQNCSVGMVAKSILELKSVG